MVEAILKKYFVPIFFILNLLLFYIIFYNGAVSSSTTNYYQVFNELEEDIITASASDQQPIQELFPPETKATATTTTTTTILPITVQKQSDFHQIMKKRMADKERGCNAVYPQHSRLHTPSLERQVYYVWVDNDYYVVSSWIRQHNALLYKIYC